MIGMRRVGNFIEVVIIPGMGEKEKGEEKPYFLVKWVDKAGTTHKEWFTSIEQSSPLISFLESSGLHILNYPIVK